MECIEHGDLGRYIPKNPQKAKADTREITKQTLKGLEVPHGRQICHRDLKPQVRLLLVCLLTVT